ncbi:hypothetical protein GQ44DRAFT_703351 [Phaeosphaeriaceae sp. PMI808]|nr:hypothetical protein GQ44DRAFT_703351 [Phaeosphaeriaceae sp. PMI808]
MATTKTSSQLPSQTCTSSPYPDPRHSRKSIFTGVSAPFCAIHAVSIDFVWKSIVCARSVRPPSCSTVPFDSTGFVGLYSMSDEAPLGDLCSICNTNKFKYRCPGCTARTCSLPCYKRHQQWAQCSGQRDPTKFVKKSQLVTPSGIDHDFNFLAGIERDIEKAEKGLETTHTTRSSWSQSQSLKGQTNYRQLEAAGVKVIQAPKGLNRQKENKSHRSKTKKSTGGHNIVWTVEWLNDQKKRQLTQTSSTCRVAAVHPFAAQEQSAAKKRKRNVEPSLTSSSSVIVNDASASENQNKSVQPQVKVEISSQAREHSPSKQSYYHLDEQQRDETRTEVTGSHNLDYHDRPGMETVGDGEYRFYLVRPRTSSSKHILIPLISSATLGECLNGRTVLEFPTIYVFPSSIQPSPAEFMLEQDYLKQEGEEQKEFNELISKLDPEILRRLEVNEQQVGSKTSEELVDSREILDVLKKDFGSLL